MKIRTGDTVVIISGKDKGKTGTVLRVLPTKNRIVVSDANMRTRHMRATPQRPGQKVQYEASLHVSNVMAIDPKTKKRTRIAHKVDSKGKKTRVAVKSGEELTKKKVAAPSKTEDKTDDKKASTAKKSAAKKPADKKPDVKKTDAPPNKKPFWKKMVDFGADDMEDAEVKEPSHMEEDHSVPEEIERQSQRSHQHNV